MYMGSEKVDLTELGQDKLVPHIVDLYSRAQLKTSDEWLDERARPDGHDTKRQLREAQNDEAIGGLRSPHRSISKVKGAARFGHWLRTQIENE